MAVTIEKKFWNGSEYKDIIKIVFTSPNFTSPATAGTRSHIQPGGDYIGTWYEAIDFLYRQQPNQDGVDLATEMESIFGKLTLSGTFDFGNDSTATFTHAYGEDLDIVGPGTFPNILYKDKDNYATILSSISGTTDIGGETFSTAEISFDSITGDKIANEWILSTTSGILLCEASGISTGSGNLVTTTISGIVTSIANDSCSTVVSGTVSGEISGIVTGVDPSTGVLTGNVDGTLIMTKQDGFATIFSSDVSSQISVDVSGPEYGTVTGTVNSTVSGALSAPNENMYHQYSDTTIDAAAITPKQRRHYGANSVIFEVSFGEAYDCRLTAWDDDTHSTTTNKILNEEHYRIDVVAYRTNDSTESYDAILRSERCMIYPPAYDIALKGNEKYYGDFDLIFVIEDDEYGEYLVFLPRLVNMDSTFSAGNYDFVTTLHYQYT